MNFGIQSLDRNGILLWLVDAVLELLPPLGGPRDMHHLDARSLARYSSSSGGIRPRHMRESFLRGVYTPFIGASGEQENNILHGFKNWTVCCVWCAVGKTHQTSTTCAGRSEKAYSDHAMPGTTRTVRTRVRVQACACVCVCA